MRRPEILAAIAGVLVVALVAAILRAGSGSKEPVRPHQIQSASPRVPLTPSGAVEAATTDLLVLSKLETGTSASVRRIVEAMAIGPLKVRLEQALPAVVGKIRTRLASTEAPAEFDGWPLGYRVDTFDPPSATVSIWHLDAAATSALGLMTADYATTTYTLAWVGEAWRISDVRNTGGPTPPQSTASPAQMNAFARAANAFSRYTYGP
jgi:hypothetical protein